MAKRLKEIEREELVNSTTWEAYSDDEGEESFFAEYKDGELCAKVGGFEIYKSDEVSNEGNNYSMSTEQMLAILGIEG